MMQYKVCVPSRCLKGCTGKPLASCKYGFPFRVPQNCVMLDEDIVRYIYVRRHIEDRLVPYNLGTHDSLGYGSQSAESVQAQA